MLQVVYYQESIELSRYYSALAEAKHTKYFTPNFIFAEYQALTSKVRRYFEPVF
jgi:hypothetical protein